MVIKSTEKKILYWAQSNQNYLKQYYHCCTFDTNLDSFILKLEFYSITFKSIDFKIQKTVKPLNSLFKNC